MTLTEKERKEIFSDFVRRHGKFSAQGFVDEVESAGPSHRAYSVFEWDDAKAANGYRLDQARDLFQGLRVKHVIEEGPSRRVKAKETQAPFAISPVGGRKNGSGYYEFDPDDPAMVAELQREAATSLQSWLNRYEFALAKAVGSTSSIESVIRLLEACGDTVQRRQKPNKSPLRLVENEPA